MCIYVLYEYNCDFASLQTHIQTDILLLHYKGIDLMNLWWFHVKKWSFRTHNQPTKYPNSKNVVSLVKYLLQWLYDNQIKIMIWSIL